MARFAINQTLVTREPRVVVDAGLRPGLHRFRLVVTDDAGNDSRPDEVLVQVSALTRLGGFVPVRRAMAVAVAPAATRAAAHAAPPAATTAATTAVTLAAAHAAPPAEAQATARAATPAATPAPARAAPARAAAAAPSPPPKPFRSRPR